MANLYSCEQIAERYGVQITTVWSWIRDRKLGAIKIGRQYRIRDIDLKEFEKETEVQ